MKRKMKCTLKLMALMLIFTSIGGCSVNQKAHTKQAQTATSSSTKRRYRSAQTKASRLFKKTRVRNYELHKVE